MAIDDRRRLQLYEAARTSLGDDAAGTLMELLPVDQSQFATRHDVATLGAELRGEFAGLRGEFAELRGEMHGEFAAVRGEMRGEVASLRAEMHELFREQTTRLVMFVVPALLSGIGLAFVAARFG